MTRIRQAVALVAVAIGVLALAACDPGGGPTVAPTPDIVWEPSEPTGPLEGDPYVQAVRAANLGWVLANNTRDFTIAQLTDTTTVEQIDAYFQRFLQTRGERNPEAVAIPGPVPSSVISVTEHADGNGADVVMCDVIGEWFVSEEHPEATIDDVRPSVTVYSVIDDGGVLKVDALSGGEGECESTGISVGRFDPAPEPSSGDLRPPLSDVD